MSIVAQNVTKLYGKQKALDNVSFVIQPGEVVGLLGPNGAGKSTMMKIITCFIPASSGEVKVNGHDVIEGSIEVRKRVGYLPENNPLYLDMYVKEYLGFLSGMYQLGTKTSKRIEEIIMLTGLGLEQHKKIGALSKGYRQRVGLAQALIHDPEVLILDEPTSGLDPNQLLEIRNLIKEIGKEKTVLLSTHIMQEVEAICDRAIIIHKGKIVADDYTKNLSGMVSKQDIITVEFNTAVRQEELAAIEGVLNVQRTKGQTWKLSADPKKDIRHDIFQFAVKKGISVLSLNRELQSLEEVFQSLTKK
jgi:ABC-2 type transport system ATP-binding protein